MVIELSEGTNKEQGKNTAQLARECIRALWRAINQRSDMTPEEIQVYISELAAKGILVDKTEHILSFRKKLEDTLIQLYGSKIGQRRIESYFKHTDTENIIVVKGEKYAQTASDLGWRLIFGKPKPTPTKKPDNVYHGHLQDGARDRYFPSAELIFLAYNEEATHPDLGFELALTEETIHGLLFKTRVSEIPLVNIWRKIGSFIDMVKTPDEEFWNNLRNHYDDPEEQITKVMVLNVFGKLNPNLSPSQTFYPDDIAAIRKGEHRIEELGWGRILKGQLTTDHEEDYKVNLDYSF